MSTLRMFSLALILIIAPSVQATDFAWHFKADAPAAWHNLNYERKGTVDFKTEGKGTFVASGANHRTQGVATPWVAQYVFRFSDLSTITARVEGTFDNASQTARGSGEFINGTGRFEGITGKTTVVAKLTHEIMEGDWVGAYLLQSRN